MAELSITAFVSLDGVMQAPGGPTEDVDGGFVHGGWVFPLIDDGFLEAITGIYAKPTAFLLGRRTWEIFAGHWPKVDDPGDPIAHKLNHLPKFVASRTRDDFPWEGSRVVRDAAREVPALKAGLAGELQVHGSATLVQTLIEHDLVDEYHVFTFPVVLGMGKRLWGTGTRPRSLELVRSRTTAKGTVISTYRRRGPLETGSFALEEDPE